jgi:hypothetical protein
LFQRKAKLLVNSLHALRVTVPAMLDEAVEKADFLNALSTDPVDRIPSEVQAIMKVTSLPTQMKSLGPAFFISLPTPPPSPPPFTGFALTGGDSELNASLLIIRKKLKRILGLCTGSEPLYVLLGA